MIALLAFLGSAGIPIPKGYSGIHWGPESAPINIELFTDIICPDCATEWPITMKVLEKYSTQVNLQVHLFELPFHTWAYVISRLCYAMDSIDHKLGQAVINGLLGDHDQDQFGTTAMQNTPEKDVTKKALAYAVEKYGVDATTLQKAFDSTEVIMRTRIDYKYTYIKNIPGTPTVYINGIQTDLTENSSFDDWCRIIDKLLE